MRKGQGRRPLLDARGLQALRRHCITHRHDSVIDIILTFPPEFTYLFSELWHIYSE